MKIAIVCIPLTAFWSVGGPWSWQPCTFLVNVEFIETIDAGRFGV